jgi:hypothetical protein
MAELWVAVPRSTRDFTPSSYRQTVGLAWQKAGDIHRRLQCYSLVRKLDC